MCFDNAKNWQLGWYNDREETVVPLNGGWTGQLVGVADSGTSTETDRVVVKVEGHTRDYYVGYNRKIGINSGTNEFGDLVAIQSSVGTGKRTSELEAGLISGTEFEIPDFGEARNSASSSG